MDRWPSSRAVTLVFERAAADSTLNEIYFAEVDFDEHWEVRFSSLSFTLSLTLIALSGHRPTVAGR
jgi:hypothetical protein